MVIEWLKFKVPSELWEAFIQRDEEVWTTGLKKFPGFLGKEVWVDPERDEIVLVIRWQTQEDWDSVPGDEQERLDQAMGDLRMPIIESRKYLIRKFNH